MTPTQHINQRFSDEQIGRKLKRESYKKWAQSVEAAKARAKELRRK